MEEVTGAEVQGVGGKAAAGKAVEETVVAATALVESVMVRWVASPGKASRVEGVVLEYLLALPEAQLE